MFPSQLLSKRLRKPPEVPPGHKRFKYFPAMSDPEIMQGILSL